VSESLSTRPTRIDINIANLLHNYKEIASKNNGSLVMPIVKANAYGHGLLRCGLALDQAGAPYLGVAYLEEALQLRTNGVKTRILVLGGIFVSQIDLFLQHDIDITASSVDKLRAINERARLKGARARVHLKIDTGMERIGQHFYTAEKLLEEGLKSSHCEIAGIFSHFAAAESEDLSLSKLQFERFQEVLRFYEKRSLARPTAHMGCSGSIMQYSESNLDMTRPGLALYGLSPARHLDKKFNLRPVLSLSTQVVFFKVVKKGAGVGYGHTWTAPEDCRLVTLPIGYGDGYSTKLSNQGEVLIRSKRYRIAGKVCMDQVMVNLGPKGEAYNTDEVIIIGSQGEESISVWDICKLLGSENPRELLVALNERIPRVYKS